MTSEFDRLKDLLTLPPNSTIVDVGANKGQFLEFAVPAYAPSTYIAVEPIPELEDVLKKHPLSQDIPKFKVLPYAVGSESRDDVMNVNGYSPISSLLFPLDSRISKRSRRGWRALVVRQETLSWILLRREKLRHIDLLKIDVQGYEIQVLTGAKNILKNVDNVMVEMIYDRCYIGQAVPEDVSNLLTDHGFHVVGAVQEHREGGKVVESDVLFERRKSR